MAVNQPGPQRLILHLDRSCEDTEATSTSPRRSNSASRNRSVGGDAVARGHTTILCGSAVRRISKSPPTPSDGRQPLVWQSRRFPTTTCHCMGHECLSTCPLVWRCSCYALKLTSLLMLQLSLLDPRNLGVLLASSAFIYSCFSIIIGAVILRTLWILRMPNAVIRAIDTPAFCMKGAFLLLKVKGKRCHLVPTSYDSRSPKEMIDLYAQGFFWWLNRLIMPVFKNMPKLMACTPSSKSLRQSRQTRGFGPLGHNVRLLNILPAILFVQLVEAMQLPRVGKLSVF